MTKKSENPHVKYAREKLHRIALDVRKEDIETYRAVAQMDNSTLNGWIKNLMQSRCKELGVEIPSQKKEG